MISTAVCDNTLGLWSFLFHFEHCISSSSYLEWSSFLNTTVIIIERVINWSLISILPIRKHHAFMSSRDKIESHSKALFSMEAKATKLGLFCMYWQAISRATTRAISHKTHFITSILPHYQRLVYHKLIRRNHVLMSFSESVEIRAAVWKYEGLLVVCMYVCTCRLYSAYNYYGLVCWPQNSLLPVSVRRVQVVFSTTAGFVQALWRL